MSRATKAVEKHVATFFRGHKVDSSEWSRGPISQRVPGFRVLKVSPGPRINRWTIVSLGVWDALHDEREHGLEFLMCGPEPTDELLETLAMVAYYHAGPPENRLDVGHTVPIGRPLGANSKCDHLLVSLPYIFGPDLEACKWRGGHARILWAIPITEAERDFKAEHGLDALEQKFEDEGVRYWDLERESLV
jgi:suppressor of fused protein SUFU